MHSSPIVGLEMVVGKVVRFPGSSQQQHWERRPAMDAYHSIQKIMRMLELQIVQVGELVAACPAGCARATLKQQHDQLLKQFAVAQEHCLMIEVGSIPLPTNACQRPPTGHPSSGW